MKEPRTIVTNVPRTREQARGWVVRIIDGDDAGRESRLPPSGVVVGSGQDATLRLSDPRASRSHVQLVPETRGVRVRDLGSTNGTTVDGRKVGDILAVAGARVGVGRTTLELHEEGIEPLQTSSRQSFGKLLGSSVAMREVFSILEKVAGSSASVLIEGETGTGKELVARALWSESPRQGKPFVALDCGAIPANLIESELFGHLRGAFTGATEQREGAFERADGGVLFLDELGELALELQPKLLRVLETQEVRKLGASTTRKVDVRVVAATNRVLDDAVEDGTFREDLYYRVAVVHVALPPLRERPEDLPLIVAGLLRDLDAEPGPIDGPNLALLAAHDWPGNVRELRNVLSRAIAQAGGAVHFRELSLHVRARKAKVANATSHIDLDVPFLEAKEALVTRFEADYLKQLLEACDGNVAEAARRSGLNRRHLHDLVNKYDLKR